MSVLPWWVAITVAVSMLGVALCCAYRLATPGHRRGGRSDDSCHLLMGIAMAGMAVSSLSTLPTSWWLVIFAGYGLWFAGRLVCTLRRQPGRQALAGTLPHLLMSGSMVYMLAAMLTMPAMPAMPGMATMPASDLLCGAWILGAHGATVASGIPVPALALAVLSFADAALTTRHVRRRPPLAATEAAGTAAGDTAPGQAPAPLVEDGAVAVLVSARVPAAWSMDSAAACHVAMALAMGLMLVTMR